jgi:hypothetical protein
MNTNRLLSVLLQIKLYSLITMKTFESYDLKDIFCIYLFHAFKTLLRLYNNEYLHQIYYRKI